MSRAGLVAALITAAAALLLLPGPVQAQSESLRLSGYLEHQLSPARTPEGWGYIDYDRLRVDLEGRAGRGASASAAVVGQLFRGRTTTRLADLVPAALRDQVPEDAVFTIPDRLFLNHAFINLDLGRVGITAGKQYLAWGRGLVFNPTELFRPRFLFDPGYEREGVGALTAALETGALSDAALVYVPEADWRTSGKVGRVRGHAAGFDLSALVAEVWEHDAVGLLLGEPASPERRRTIGGDLSGEPFGLGLWLEGTWSTQADIRWVELTVGGNFTLPGDVLVNLEGYFDGRGRWSDPYPLEDWLALATGARRTLGRTMLFTSVSRPTGDLLTLAVSALANAGDQSVALLPSIVYSFAENVDLFLQVLVPLGPDGTEFGTRDPGGLIRGRVYF